MGANEDALRRILDAPAWEAPDVRSLEISIGSLERVLGDLSQVDGQKWSGAAAQGASEAFGTLREQYSRVKNALRDVGEAVSAANQARERARSALGELPSAQVPSWIHGAVAAADAAGEVNVVIDGYAYVADQAVGIFEGWLGNKREDQARQALETLQQELEPQRERIQASRYTINHQIRRELGLDGDVEIDGFDGPGSSAVPGSGLPGSAGGGPAVPYPVPPVPAVPGPNLGPVSTGGGGFGSAGGLNPHIPSGEGAGWTPATPGSHVDIPGGTPHDGSPSWTPGLGGSPDVDSGSGGTIGGSGAGFTAGALGGGAIAGAAALRWGSRAAGAGGAGMGASGAMPGGGLGGLLGAGGSTGTGAGTGGAGGLGRAGGMAGGAGARGLAGGLTGGGASGSGAAGSSSGAAGSAASGGARGGMVGGGAPAGAGASSGKRQQKPGLGGHIAPRLEDDDEFMPQSDAARAGGRDTTGDA